MEQLKNYSHMDTEEMSGWVSHFEATPMIHNEENLLIYKSMINELFKRNPEKYWHRWYYFIHVNKNATYKDYLSWRKTTNYIKNTIENKRRKKNMREKHMYIYNLQQALFFIQNGLIPTEISISKKTKKVYFKFVRDEKTEQVFTKWVERGKKNNKE